MTNDELFCRTMEDLRSREHSGDPYELLIASGMLRKLLLDGHSLLDEVNRTRRHRCHFVVAEAPAQKMILKLKDVCLVIGDGLDPDTVLAPATSRSLNRDQFLAYEVIFIRSKSYSVRQIIQLAANVLGGVHVGKATRDWKRELEELGKSFRVGGANSVVRQLPAIIRIVVKALDPLDEAVRIDRANRLPH